MRLYLFNEVPLPIVQKMKCLFLLVLVSLLVCKSDYVVANNQGHPIAHEALIEYDKVEANVPFSKVAALQSRTPDHTFIYGEQNDQYILHWQGRGDKKTTVLVFIHGGCWLSQYNIDHSKALTSAFADYGYDVYSIEYRRTGNGGEWPVAFEDVQLAFKTIIAKIVASKTDKYDVSDMKPDNSPLPRINILGHSAGGHLATLLASSVNFEKTGVYSSNIGLFGLAPIIDLIAYSNGENSCQKATPNFMQGSAKQFPDKYDKATPLHQPLHQIANVTMFVGSADSIVPAEMAKHPDAKFKLLNGAGHFDWIHPGSDAFKQLISALNKAEK